MQVNSSESLSTHGFSVEAGVFLLEEISQMLAWLPELGEAAGTRSLLDIPECRELAADPRIRTLVEADLGSSAIPVRGILFDKNPNANWVLGFHQDRKIAVKQRIEVLGFTAWSEKEGVTHCQPPKEVLEQCLAVRIHLDDCGPENGPLRVVPGSHLNGLNSLNTDLPKQTLPAKAGDVILMKPLLWHASSKATNPSHRRVIHIEFSSARLPSGLEWAFA